MAACKVAGEQYKKNFTEFVFTLENPETEVAVSNLDGLRTDIVKRRNDRSHTSRLSSYCIHLSSQQMTSPSDVPASRNLELSAHS